MNFETTIVCDGEQVEVVVEDLNVPREDPELVLIGTVAEKSFLIESMGKRVINECTNLAYAWNESFMRRQDIVTDGIEFGKIRKTTDPYDWRPERSLDTEGRVVLSMSLPGKERLHAAILGDEFTTDQRLRMVRSVSRSDVDTPLAEFLARCTDLDKTERAALIQKLTPEGRAFYAENAPLSHISKKERFKLFDRSTTIGRIQAFGGFFVPEFHWGDLAGNNLIRLDDKDLKKLYRKLPDDYVKAAALTRWSPADEKTWKYIMRQALGFENPDLTRAVAIDNESMPRPIRDRLLRDAMDRLRA